MDLERLVDVAGLGAPASDFAQGDGSLAFMTASGKAGSGGFELKLRFLRLPGLDEKAPLVEVGVGLGETSVRTFKVFKKFQRPFQANRCLLRQAQRKQAVMGSDPQLRGPDALAFLLPCWKLREPVVCDLQASGVSVLVA